MNIQVIGQTELHLSRFDVEELNVSLGNFGNGKSDRYSAIAMFVTSIARCTFAVLDHYAMRMEVTTENIVTLLTWDFIQDQTRVSQITMKIYWPELLVNRIASVERASDKCTLSTMISDCVDINTSVYNTSDDK